MESEVKVIPEQKLGVINYKGPISDLEILVSKLMGWVDAEEIEYEGDVFRSEPQKPLETSGIEKLSFEQPDLEGPVSIMLDTPENKNGEKKYYLWYFEEDWEVRAEIASKYLYDPNLDKVITYTYPPVAQGWCYNSTDQIILGSNESYAENRVVGKIIQVPMGNKTEDRIEPFRKSSGEIPCSHHVDIIFIGMDGGYI